MIPVLTGERIVLLHGDARQLATVLPANSVDAIVTDPPYELGFMGRAWDKSGIAFDPALWAVLLHVLKPGGHLLSCGGSRTYHRMACAVEDAGFEIRDSLQWLYGSGFPKSLNVSKAIDASLGLERPILGDNPNARPIDGDGSGYSGATSHDPHLTGPASAAAAQWEGWGSALKPAYEPIVLARKPLDGTLIANVQKWGTGALNIGGCRIDMGAEYDPARTQNCKTKQSGDTVTLNVPGHSQPTYNAAGRWPANVLLDEEAAAQLDASQPRKKSRKGKPRASAHPGDGYGMTHTGAEYDDEGGPSRFFYTAKPGKSEKNAGCEHLPLRSAGEATGGRAEGSAGLDNPRAGAGRTAGARNFHPTVKPVELMRYLCRLITPPGGIVLDPFTGSGTTGIAALAEGFRFVGVELTDDYLPIITARLQHALNGG